MSTDDETADECKTFPTVLTWHTCQLDTGKLSICEIMALTKNLKLSKGFLQICHEDTHVSLTDYKLDTDIYIVTIFVT